MARINIEFNDKKYSIEYNREAIVKMLSSNKNDDSEVEQAVSLIYWGLYKHHKNEMPEREEIYSWLLSMGDQVESFVKALQSSIEDVLTAVGKEQKQGNFKWEVVK